jgi:endonuclease/exonuclease/phosphatase family metal-dependent hydrolase
MKTNFAFLFFCLFPLILFAQKTEQLNVMTFNIRYDNPDDGVHNWKHRKDAAAELILRLKADVVGTQEVLHHQLEDLSARLPMYDHFGVGRADGKTMGEYSAVFYRSDKFDLLDSGTFWLSLYPDSVASVGWDASMERIATWGLLKNKVSGSVFAIFNTHFDHRGKEARRESAKLILQKIKEIGAGHPVILTGDFNGIPDSDPIQIIRNDGLLHDVSLVADAKKGPSWTFHDFGREAEKNRRQIDYIFVNDDFNVKLYHNVYETIGSTFHSDHNPVLVHLEYLSNNK